MNTTVEKTNAPSITLTAAAIDQVKFLMRKKGSEALGLRLGVRGGGCSGLSYVMRLEEAPAESDFVLEQGGIRIFIDRKSARFLDGVTLDYSLANLLEGGWKWINPNAARSCGCGTSFTPK